MSQSLFVGFASGGNDVSVYMLLAKRHHGSCRVGYDMSLGHVSPWAIAQPSMPKTCVLLLTSSEVTDVNLRGKRAHPWLGRGIKLQVVLCGAG